MKCTAMERRKKALYYRVERIWREPYSERECFWGTGVGCNHSDRCPEGTAGGSGGDEQVHLPVSCNAAERGGFEPPIEVYPL